MAAHQINKLLGLDVGERRIGVAVANTIARLPRPVETVLNDENVWDALRRIILDEQIDAVVVGRPRNMSGEETAQTQAVRTFMVEFQQHFPLRVMEQDETLTSRRAEAELEQRGRKFSKGDIDALAAVYILEDFLVTFEQTMEKN